MAARRALRSGTELRTIIFSGSRDESPCSRNDDDGLNGRWLRGLLASARLRAARPPLPRFVRPSSIRNGAEPRPARHSAVRKLSAWPARASCSQFRWLIRTLHLACCRHSPRYSRTSLPVLPRRECRGCEALDSLQDAAAP